MDAIHEPLTRIVGLTPPSESKCGQSIFTYRRSLCLCYFFRSVAEILIY